MRFACSWSGRVRPGRAWPSIGAPPSTSRSSASSSTACRWRWSWPRRGCGPCRWRCRRQHRRDDRLEGQGWRVPLARHATLRASIEWSFELIGPAEQQLLIALATFRSPFDIDAAGIVASAMDSADDASEHLSRLTDVGLLQVDDDSGRYRMLNTVRQFCRDVRRRAGPSRQADEVHVPVLRQLVRGRRCGTNGPRAPTVRAPDARRGRGAVVGAGPRPLRHCGCAGAGAGAQHNRPARRLRCHLGVVGRARPPTSAMACGPSRSPVRWPRPHPAQ